MTDNTASIKTPLARARGLGAAKAGVHHWWMQRVSAVALIPLSLYLLSQLPHIVSSDYDMFLTWLSQPVPALALLLFIVTAFYHAALGVQVVIEDYIHAPFVKTVVLIATKVFFFFTGFAAAFAVIKINFGL